MKRKYFTIFFLSLLLLMPTILYVYGKPTYEEIENELKMIKKNNPLVYYYYLDDITKERFEICYPIKSLDLSYLHNPAYGEDNQLDQFTDNFINETFVMVKDVVIQNDTLDCMELNYTQLQVFTTDKFQMREHDYYASYEPTYTFSYDSGQESAETYTNDPSLGRGYNFFSIDSGYAEGKYLRFRWKWDSDYSLYKNIYIDIWDGTYDRTNDTHFPDDNAIITFGNGLLYRYRTTAGDNSWQVYDLELTLDTWGHSEDNVTFMWMMTDGNNQYYGYMYIDWIEINSASGGSGNLFTIDFDATTNRVTELSGTDGDYAYMNNTGLPFSSGGYLEDGFFITEDYLNYTLGSSLVLLTNSTIPSGTDLTVQFSNDNSTWVNNKNVAGYNTITEGFLSLDLRNLNYTDIFIMYNFTGTDTNTPRLYQSRLITTGNATIGGGGTTTVYIDRFPSQSLLMLIFLLSIGFLLVYGVSRRK